MCFLFVSCSSTPQAYDYPTAASQEIDRFCQFAMHHWGKRHFVVETGKVILQRPFYSGAASQAPLTSLPDGIYYCGQETPQKFPCAVGATRGMNGENCLFEAQ
ncbi:hypothetical protein WDW89_20390 [Deltaproteobacteria bacterium TL4]